MKNYKDILLSPGSTIREALKIIDSGTIKIGVVVDENEKLVGTITDGDIRRGILNNLSLDDVIDLNINLVGGPYKKTPTFNSDFVDLKPLCISNGIPCSYMDNKIELMNIYESERNMKAFTTYRGATSGCEYTERFILIKEVEK